MPQPFRNGDFSSLLPGKVINDPLTGQPFVGNIIPKSRLSPAAQNLLAIPKMAPMMPKPLAAAPNTMMPTNLNLTVHIPFKYYGFARPSLQGDANRGFFMEGDNILVAAEGDVLEKRYLIVALTPNAAKVEDTQLKQGQDLAVTPEATAQ